MRSLFAWYVIANRTHTRNLHKITPDRNVHRPLASVNVSATVGSVQLFRVYVDNSVGRFKRKKSAVIIVMTMLNIVMWVVATSHMAISFEQNFHAFLYRHAADDPTVWEDNASPNIYSQISLEAVNVCVILLSYQKSLKRL